MILRRVQAMSAVIREQLGQPSDSRDAERVALGPCRNKKHRQYLVGRKAHLDAGLFASRGDRSYLFQKAFNN